jgi:CO dehydrogenase maturation factor
MEHLSRRTTHKVDLLFMVSDPTVKGVLTAKRINALIDELDLEIEKRVLLINRVAGPDGEKLKTLAESYGLTVGGLIPQDNTIFEYDLQGLPIATLPSDSVALSSIYQVLDSLGIP